MVVTTIVYTAATSAEFVLVDAQSFLIHSVSLSSSALHETTPTRTSAHVDFSARKHATRRQMVNSDIRQA